jgi:hypothetical protein
MQKKIIWFVSILVLLSIIAGGCAQAEYAMESPMADSFYVEEEMEIAESSPAFEGDSDINAGFSSIADSTEATKRIVIKNASLTITVPDPSEVVSEIALMAERMGGWVVSSSTTQEYYWDAEAELTNGRITIRIPAEGLNSALGEIKTLTIDPKEDVTSQQISGQDVTSEYTDLESRLRNLEDAAEQLRGFMENAEDTESVLEVFYQLNDVNEEIELVKGQLQYYAEAAAMSSISVEVLPKYEPVEPDPYEAPEWDPKGVFSETIERLVEFFQDFIDFMIRFVFGFLPRLILILLPFALVLYIIILFVRKTKKSGKKPHHTGLPKEGNVQTAELKEEKTK